MNLINCFIFLNNLSKQYASYLNSNLKTIFKFYVVIFNFYCDILIPHYDNKKKMHVLYF